MVEALSIPADKEEWSPRLKVYFKAIQQYHARPKDTPLGELMVTNLSSFPSALTVIPVPNGDIRKHRQAFIVNEDLKRLQCSGRSGMTLSDPTKATQDKFLSLYKTSDRVPFSESVLELVKLSQLALFIFGKLDPEYTDGLLCDVTEKATNDWWTEVGSEYYNVEPTDGILGPTTVAALLGMLMGARNRLSWYGAPVAKDVFDIDNTKRGIGSFQKAHKLERTRRLDHQTLRKLHSVTAKAAAGEGGWGVQKAVKSTVEGFGGKRGEIISGMVGRKERANIGDIETLDIDKFVSLVSGERAKWLWHGKPRRTTDHHEKPLPDVGNRLFGKEDGSGLASRRSQSIPFDEEVEARAREEPPSIYSAPAPDSATSVLENPGDKDALRKNVFKSVAGKVSDARSGLGRIRDAVGGGLRGHASRPSRDETPPTGYTSPSISSLAQSSGALTSPVVGRAFTWKAKPEEYANAFRKERELEATTAISMGLMTSDTPPNPRRSVSRVLEESEDFVDAPSEFPQTAKAGEIRKELIASDISVAGSVVEEGDLQGPFLAAERNAQASFSVLQRRHSTQESSPRLGERDLDEARWPRRLSFSAAEDAILAWDDIIDVTAEPDDLDAEWALKQLSSKAEIARQLHHQILTLRQEVSPWVGENLAALEALSDVYGQQQEDLQNRYYQLSDAYQRAKQTGQEILAEERARATEAVKDVEVLVAKLEYEINALDSKVQDAEDGVRQFELQVNEMEKRAEELKIQLETESWPHWFVRCVTGVGTGPNITRGPRLRRT